MTVKTIPSASCSQKTLKQKTVQKSVLFGLAHVLVWILSDSVSENL